MLDQRRNYPDADSHVGVSEVAKLILDDDLLYRAGSPPERLREMGHQVSVSNQLMAHLWALHVLDSLEELSHVRAEHLRLRRQVDRLAPER